MLLNISVLQLALLPPVILVVSGLVLFHFQQLYRFLSIDLKDYLTIPLVRGLQPYVRHIRLALEQLLGNASGFKFNFSHVLLMAVVVLLLAIYNALQRNNKLMEQQLQLLMQQKLKKNRREKNTSEDE